MANKPITQSAFQEWMQTFKEDMMTQFSNVKADVKADISSVKADVMDLKAVRVWCFWRWFIFYCFFISIFTFAFCCTQSSSSSKDSFEQFKVYCEDKFAAQSSSSNIPPANSESQDEMLSPVSRITKRRVLKRKSPSSPDSQEEEAAGSLPDTVDYKARISFGISSFSWVAK